MARYLVVVADGNHILACERERTKICACLGKPKYLGDAAGGAQARSSCGCKIRAGCAMIGGGAWEQALEDWVEQ